MSLVVNPNIISSALWATKASLPTPTPKSNGAFFTMSMDPRCGTVTAIAFAETDPTLLGVGTSDGSVFLVHLAKNKVSLITKLPHAVSSVSVGHVQKLFCTSLQQLYMVNTDACRVQGKAVTPHQNAITIFRTNVMFPGVALTMSLDAIAVWDTVKCECRANSRGPMKLSVAGGKGSANQDPIRTQFVDGHLLDQGHIVTVHTTGVITLWDVHTLEVLRQVSLGHRRPASLAVCARFFAVAVSQEPEVLFLTPELEGISSVQLPGSSRGKQISIVEEDIIAVQLTDGHAWFLEADSYAISFAISTPANTPVKYFATAGSMYAVVATDRDVTWYHLLAAKRNYDRNFSGSAVAAPSAGGETTSRGTPSSSKLLPFVRAPTEKTQGGLQQDIPTEQSESNEAPLPREPIDVNDDARVNWLKVNLATNPADSKKPGAAPKTLLLNDVVKQMYRQDIEVSTAAATGSKNSVTGPGKSSVAKDTTSGSSTKPSTLKRKDPSSNEAAGNQQSNNIAMRPLLDHDSRVINMDKLRVMLMRYGVYPEKYRTIIWRFLLQLPDKRALTPQYQALAEKGSHPATATLLEPFPLPRTKLRALLEDALAAVCWNSPVLSVVHFTPNLLFPFVQLYGSDTQSAIEVFLSVLVNWGQEFFTYYPSPPVGLLSLIGHTLKQEDVQLWNHLDEFSVGAEVWVWSVIQSLYTEVFTKEEWLQIMDHALSNRPVWLWCLHVQWVVHLREPLLQLHDHAQLCAMFRKMSPLNLNLLIQQAYRLQQRLVESPLSAPYSELQAFRDGAYPSVLECDEVVITSKLRELQRIAEHEQEKVASRGRVEQITKQLAQAAMLEDAFVGKQRAVVTAKFEAANEVWVQQVQLERERQRLRDVEHETRLMGIREQLRSAQRLSDLQLEINAATQSTRDAEVDRKREVVQWDFADRMAMQEMERLEAGAKLKLQTIAATTASLTDLAEPEHFSVAQTNRPRHDAPSSTSEAQQQQQQQQRSNVSSTNKPPLPRPSTKQSMMDAETHVDPNVFSVGRHDTETMTELPPVCPTRPYAASTLPPQQTQPSSSSTGTSQTHNTTTTTASSCDTDPVLYYRKLQQSIQEGVERAQREQRENLAALESRFARQLLLDDQQTVTTTTTTAQLGGYYTASSDVTEAVVDEETTESSDRPQLRRSNNNNNNAARVTSSSSSSSDHSKGKVRKGTKKTNPTSQRAGAPTTTTGPTERGEEDCSLLDSSTEASNMTTALLRQPPSSLLQLVERDRQRAGQ